MMSRRKGGLKGVEGWGGGVLTQADCHKQRLQKIGEALLLHLHRQQAVQVTHQVKLVTRLGGQQLQRL